MYGPTQSLAQWSMSFLHAMQYAVWAVASFGFLDKLFGEGET